MTDDLDPLARLALVVGRFGDSKADDTIAAVATEGGGTVRITYGDLAELLARLDRAERRELPEPKTYTVLVSRDEDAWNAEIEELQGAHTFARNIIELDPMVREVIALAENMPDGAEPHIQIEYKYAPGTSWTDFTPAEAAELELDLMVRTDIIAPRNELDEPCPWPWDPEQLKSQPIGQYHCPYCGGMQVAGIRHLDHTGAPDGPEDGR